MCPTALSDAKHLDVVADAEQRGSAGLALGVFRITHSLGEAQGVFLLGQISEEEYGLRQLYREPDSWTEREISKGALG